MTITIDLGATFGFHPHPWLVPLALTLSIFMFVHLRCKKRRQPKSPVEIVFDGVGCMFETGLAFAATAIIWIAFSIYLLVSTH